jgi:hypothetical protein
MTDQRFRQLLLEALETLGVATEVAPVAAAVDAQGRATADLRIGGPEGGQVSVVVPDTSDEDRVAGELRGELRRALRMCPLCQRVGHVEKLRNAEGQQEACLVRCPACGDFEIEQALVRDLRQAWERGDRPALDRASALSDRVKAGRPGRLTRADLKS